MTAQQPLNETANLLKNCSLFASLPEDALLQLATEVELLTLKSDDILFHQGDIADFLFILVEGRLVTFYTTATNETKIVGSVGILETVGELGALSQEPRSLTAKATTDAKLFKLSSEAFQTLCKTYPSVLLETVQPIIQRSLHNIKLLQNEWQENIAVIFTANQDVHWEEFKLQFEKENTQYPLQILQLTPDAYLKEIDNILEQVKKQKNVTLIFLTSSSTKLSVKDLEKIRRYYFIAEGEGKIVLDTFAKNMLETLSHIHNIRRELILLHKKNCQQPIGTRHWLALADFNLHHHIRMEKNSDYQRLIRFITGHAICMVLGGGGVKGLVHCGVIKAILEKGLSIDAIAGTSAGATAAACYAYTENYQQFLEFLMALKNAAAASITMKCFTWPIISFFSSIPGTHTLQKIFKNNLIEDLWIPFFCISTNLSRQCEYTHKTGEIWRAIRASSSLPAMVPPVVIDGELHLDGGLLNNLPVDVMRQMVGLHQVIIASKLATGDIDKTKYDFPCAFSFKDSLLLKLGLKKEKYLFPAYLDTFYNALVVGSSYKENQNSLAVNMLINPNLSAFGLLNFSKEQDEILINIGYQETMKILEKQSLKS